MGKETKMGARKRKIAKPFAMLLATLTLTVGVTGATTITPTENAYALDAGCPVYAGNDNENEEYANLGGMTTNQINWLQTFGTSGSPVKTDNPGLTFPEQFKDNLSYVQWVPGIPAKDKSGLDGNREISGASWDSFNRGIFTNADKSLPETSVSNPDIVGFLNDRGFCRIDIAFKNSATVLPNMFLGFGKFLYDLTDTFYITAMGGSTNTTNVVGLTDEAINADSFDDIYIIDESNNDSWFVQIADRVEEGLVGEDGEGGLYDALFLTFLLPLVFIAAIVIIVNLLRTKAVKALTGFVWVIVVIALGVSVLQSPMAIPKFVDGLVGTVGNTAATAITGAASDTESDLCTIESDSRNQINKDAAEVSCRIWENTIYSAWKEGQFGASDAIEDAEATNFIQNTYGPEAGNAAAIAAESSFDNFFTGEGQTYHAVMGIIAIGAVGIFVGGNAILLIAYQISLLLLIFTAPIFFVAGIVPSSMGRGIFLRWAELIVGIVVKKLVVTILLAVFLAMFFIIASIDFGNLLVQSLLFGIITYIGFTQRSRIIEMFTGKINFGGDKSISMGSAIEKVAERAPTVAKGAALVAGGAAAYGAGKAATAGGKFAVNKVGDARAKGKINKLISEGNRVQAKNVLQDRAAKRGAKFEATFVNDKSEIDFEGYANVQEQRAAAKVEKIQARQDNSKAQTILSKAAQDRRQGTETVSSDDIKWATAQQNTQKAVKAKKVSDKTKDKLITAKNDKERERIINTGRRKASKLGEEGQNIFNEETTDETVEKQRARKVEEINQAAALTKGKKDFKKSHNKRVQARNKAYGREGQEYVSRSSEKA